MEGRCKGSSVAVGYGVIDGLSRFCKSGWVISRVTRSKRHGGGTPGQLALVCFHIFHCDAFNFDIPHSCPTSQSLCIP